MMGRVKINIFCGNSEPALRCFGKLVMWAQFLRKKEWSLSDIIQFSYQIFIYSIVYIDENHRAAIFSNNLSRL